MVQEHEGTLEEEAQGVSTGGYPRQSPAVGGGLDLQLFLQSWVTVFAMTPSADLPPWPPILTLTPS